MLEFTKESGQHQFGVVPNCNFEKQEKMRKRHDNTSETVTNFIDKFLDNKMKIIFNEFMRRGYMSREIKGTLEDIYKIARTRNKNKIKRIKKLVKNIEGEMKKFYKDIMPSPTFKIFFIMSELHSILIHYFKLKGTYKEKLLTKFKGREHDVAEALQMFDAVIDTRDESLFADVQIIKKEN